MCWLNVPDGDICADARCENSSPLQPFIAQNHVTAAIGHASSLHWLSRRAKRRMRAMRRRVREFDVSHWAASFLGALHRASEPS